MQKFSVTRLSSRSRTIAGLRLNSKYAPQNFYTIVRIPYFREVKDMRRVLLVVGALTLAACASKPSVSEFQCKAGDWESIGYRDGISGIESTQILTHQEACGEFGIVPDRNRYLAGWESGVREYCTFDNGFNLGERGGRKNSLCKGELQEPFATGFEDGRKLYLARREVDRITNQLRSHDSRLVEIKHELVDVTTAQLDPTLLPEERIQLLARMDTLNDERVEIRSAIPQLEQDLIASEAELERVNQELSRVDYR